MQDNFHIAQAFQQSSVCEAPEWGGLGAEQMDDQQEQHFLGQFAGNRCSNCLNIQTQADRQVTDMSQALQAAISLIPPDRLPDVDQRLRTLMDMHDRAEWARTVEHEAWRAKANALLNVVGKIADGCPDPQKLAQKAKDIAFKTSEPFRSRFEGVK